MLNSGSWSDALVIAGFDFASLGTCGLVPCDGWGRRAFHGFLICAIGAIRSCSANSASCRRLGVPAARLCAGPGMRSAWHLRPAEWPTIAVTCLAFESRIASGPGVAVLHGHIPNLRTALEEAIARGCSGIISFGIAGGLAPDLAPGAWVVASGVVAAHRRYADRWRLGAAAVAGARLRRSRRHRRRRRPRWSSPATSEGCAMPRRASRWTWSPTSRQRRRKPTACRLPPAGSSSIPRIGRCRRRRWSTCVRTGRPTSRRC